MIRITIEIDVKNHEEIIRQNKGILVSNLASMLGSSKVRVEEEIKRRARRSLQKNIKESLEENGVVAEISIY